MDNREILLEGVLFGTLLERTEADFNLNRNRLVNSNFDRVEANVSNLIKNNHMKPLEISNIMIRMLVADIEKLYKYATVIDNKASNIIWKQYRSNMRQEINSLNNGNLLQFKTNNFKKYTSDAINSFQNIIAKDKNSEGYKQITSAGYRNNIIGFKRYFEGMDTAMNFFIQQKNKATPVAEKISQRITNNRIRIESAGIGDNVKNIAINTVIITVLYVSSVALLTRYNMKPKSYVNVGYNLSLIYKISSDAKQYGWVKAWVFRLFFLIVGIGVYQNISNVIQIIRYLVNKKPGNLIGL